VVMGVELGVYSIVGSSNYLLLLWYKLMIILRFYMSCLNLEFCHTKSDSTCPRYIFIFGMIPHQPMSSPSAPQPWGFSISTSKKEPQNDAPRNSHTYVPAMALPILTPLSRMSSCTRHGTMPGSPQGCQMCGCMIYGTPWPAIWSIQDAVYTKSPRYWDTVS
jgi:hypothetical protein